MNNMKNRPGWIFDVYERFRYIILGIVFGIGASIIISYLTAQQDGRTVSGFALVIALLSVIFVIAVLLFNRQGANGK